ncbi:MAG TPA: DUF4032 domain-containing protein [Roseiflexaceae bacterium]|nr:DUF4032 domain-containing protein [Roseiflexaceae bacterium]HMP42490.1 DUF4032 domain-containing protein [Roseiflexaceae bacterium]
MSDAWTRKSARNAFDDARRRALVSTIVDIVRGRSHTMLSFEEVRARLNVRGQRYLGLRTVPLDHIIGSEGRYGAFDRRFLPLSAALKARWVNISNAMIRDVPLPPIDLYKIGDIYFVRDGNHRVSVARQRGQVDIDAYVTELIVDVPLEPDLSVHDLILKEEYSDFLEWTGLHDLRPDERIEFTEPGGYLELIRHINAHRYYMGMNREDEVSRDTAVADWYDTVYMPVIELMRREKVLEHFPGRTEADLYRWIMEHRWYMRERLGDDPGPEQAIDDYVERFGHRDLQALLADALQWLRTRE